MEKTFSHTKINDKMYYGKHTIIDCKRCDVDLLEIFIIKDFIRELVNAIGMIAHGSTVIDRFGSGEDSGISACQLITTSSITIHTNDLHRDCYIDVFSCTDYSESIIIDMIKDYFDPAEINMTILLRK
jgi:S-adenosylmethionine/arginine decarboxylase-like enzyme